MGDSEDTQELNTPDLDPRLAFVERFKRLLATDAALHELRLEPGVEVMDGEPNVLAVTTRDGNTLFIEVNA